MKKLLTLLLIAVTSQSFASSKISYLSVKDEVVYFSTTSAKIHAIPDCVATENQQKWAIPMGNLNGRAMYSMLVTAVAANSLVTINSKNSCDVTGFESPIEIALGTDDALPTSAGLYKSCDEIVQNNPTAQDGLYAIRPGTAGTINAYCDMEWDGGWMLVMHGQEGDVPLNWHSHTTEYNVLDKNLPDGTTFKYSDTFINLLNSHGYRVTHNNMTRYFKPTCTYRHNASAGGDCIVSYETADFQNPALYPWTHSSFGGVVGHSKLSGTNTYFINTSLNSVIGWQVGLDSSTEYALGDGSQKSSPDISASFNLWVR
ncbi:fibrinogen-like YCDxxxxGGGW domain-containing protein [Colwellia sp. E150_009]